MAFTPQVYKQLCAELSRFREVEEAVQVALEGKLKVAVWLEILKCCTQYGGGGVAEKVWEHLEVISTIKPLPLSIGMHFSVLHLAKKTRRKQLAERVMKNLRELESNEKILRKAEMTWKEE